jgi:rhodanese-related sulfurtransferase
VSQITPSQLCERLRAPAAPKLLDVREPEEHALVALPGSVLVPLGELGERMDELDAWKNEEVVVYCHHGVRSLHAIGYLRQAGFQRLVNLAGGIDRWSLDVDPATPRY